jgi:hypothetical protein
LSSFGGWLAAANRYGRESMGDGVQRLAWKDRNRFDRFITKPDAIKA